MSETDELASAQLRMRKDGSLYLREDGKEVEVATYNRNTGHLEFLTKEFSVKYYNQATAKIGTVNKGKDESGLKIRSMSVKGDAVVDLSKIPKRPKMGELGDAAEDVVQWYLDHNLPEAIARYGIYTDANGNPIKRPVKRVVERTVDARDLDVRDLPAIRDGRSSEIKAPVYREGELIEERKGIVARRATALTFTPQEVVGGFDAEDDVGVPAGASEEDGG